MKRLIALAAVAAVTVGIAYAAELKSGLQSGQKIGAFDVKKVGGAADDGVSVGKELCYRCKYGSSPMVMVFTHKTDEKTVELVKKLDAAVAKNSDIKMRAFVNVLADDMAAAEKSAQELASAASPTNVPIVVPVEFKNGPDNYGLSPEAQLTVIIANDGQVVANHTFETGLMCESCMESIMSDVTKMASK